jgi:hypothetical protein
MMVTCLYQYSFTAVLLCIAGVANAQTYPCPAGPGPGEVQVGTTGGSNGVAAVAICSPSTVNTGPAYSRRWIAIAVDGQAGAYGGAKDMSTKRKAEKAAIAACVERGGKKCIASSTYNQCLALSWGNTAFSSYRSPSRVEAEEKATTRCQELTDQCDIYYSECTQAVLIR